MQTGAMISAQQREVNEYFRQAAEYWSDVYSRTEVHGVIYQERRARVLALIDALCLPRTANVLEIGCGAGLTSVELAKRGYEVTAVDAVEAMLESTRKLAAEAGVADRLATRIADLRNLPF